MHYAVVHQALVGYQANQRQGTQSARTRAEVSGGGRKPWGQKYTGNARQGSTRAPQWRHGGIVFAPKPRDYRVTLPKRMRHLALRSVLSAKVRDGKLVIVESFGLSKVSTKDAARVLKNLGATTSTLVVHNGAEEALVPSARNIENVYTVPARLLNVYELLRKDRVVMTTDAVQEAERLWGQAGAAATKEGSA
jgi:large subunit ribosomal protein L4